MSKNVAVFVDVANLYYSARGQDVDVDYVALLKTATKGRDLIRAYAYSGLDPENENQRKFIDFLGKNGYKVLTKDIRKFGDGRVKANLDIELVVDLFRLADRMDIAVIVSGDGDFAPAIRALQDQGVRCEVISFRPNTSSDLIAVADEFIDVMKIAGIGRGSKEARAQRGMSAPEMPAKEVVPEFGFREASPSVAKAALAAIRGDGRARGRGRAAAPDEAVEEPVAATGDNGAAVAESEGDGRRRRRRRGGRGRGRGRSRAEQGAEAPEAPEATGEIGWTELDDLSQIDGVQAPDGPEAEREYTFEEADEATLAELGLLDGTDQAAVTPQPEEKASEKKPASRRGRTRKADADATAAEVATASDGAGETVDEAPKKPRRTRTSRKADASDASAAGEGGEEPAAKPARRSRAASASKTSTRGTRGRKTAAEPVEATEGEAKPSRRRSRSSAAKDEASAAGSDQEGDQGQGIWSRFRSARGTTRPS